MWVGAPHRPPHPVDLPHPVPPPPPGMLLTPTLPLNILFFRESPPARCPQHPYPWDAQAPASVLSLCLSVCLSRPPPQGPTHVPSRAIGAKPPSPHHDPSLDGAGGRPTPHQAPPPLPPLSSLGQTDGQRGAGLAALWGGGGGSPQEPLAVSPTPGCRARAIDAKAAPCRNGRCRTLPAPCLHPPESPVGAPRPPGGCLSLSLSPTRGRWLCLVPAGL